MFEVITEDLLGRIGRLRTKGGRRVETPAFLPVINPVFQDIPASWMRENLGAEIVITNAYILYRRMREEATRRGVHGVLGFDGAIMTDSGGYQILEYGGVEATPEEVAAFEEEIGTDIAVPLDVPTGIGDRRHAEETVERTIRNLEATLEALEERGVTRALWVGTVQGGVHLDLLKRCAEKVREMGFDLYALGSPTPLMERYQFDKLFRMIAACRSIVEPGKPLHLFGAGHPMIFPFVVALGVDMFDSASYYLYAKDDRYITESGTLRLERMDYLPCVCPVCSRMDLGELKSLPKRERTEMIAKHNLYVCFREIAEIKQAIKDGRLMELMEIRARSHPYLYHAFREIMMDDQVIEMMRRHTPLYSRRGISVFDSLSLRRPEVGRARDRLRENIFSGRRRAKAILIPYTVKASIKRLEKIVEGGLEDYDLLLYGSPYGLIPVEIRYVYPFSQTEFPKSLAADEGVIESVYKQIVAAGYREILVLEARNPHIREAAKRIVERLSGAGIAIKTVPPR